MGTIGWNDAVMVQDGVDNTRIGVALNDNGYIMVSLTIDGQLTYYLGILSSDGSIDWKESNTIDELAISVRVALNIHNAIVIVFDVDDGHYMVGQIDYGKINWGDVHRYAKKVNTPAIDLDDNGRMVSVYQNDSDVRYRVGQLNGTTINWGAGHRYGKGKQNPTVAIDSDGHTVSLFQDGDIDPTLYYQEGQINGEEIDWDDRHTLTNGHGTSISMDSSNVAEVHISPSLQSNWYHFGSASGGNIAWGSDHEFSDIDGGSLEVAIRNDGLAAMAFLRNDPTGSQLWVVTGQAES